MSLLRRARGACVARFKALFHASSFTRRSFQWAALSALGIAIACGGPLVKTEPADVTGNAGRGATPSETAGSTPSSSTTDNGGGSAVGSGGTNGKACGARAGDTCGADEYCAYVPSQLCGQADAQSSCKPRPRECNERHAPVCGCDGKTYANSCFASAAGTGVYSDGECKQ